MDENSSEEPKTRVIKVIQEEPKTLKRSSIKLQQQFKRLEQDWKSFKQSSSKPNPNKSSSSLNNRLLDNSSPRDLMSALQQQQIRGKSSSSSPFSSPITVTTSGQVWRVRENELAKEEIRRERKLALKSGKLRGRRLFEEEDEEEEEQRMWCFEEREREVVVLKEASKEREVGKGFAYGGKKSLVIIFRVCFAICLMAFVLGIVGGFDGYGSGAKKVILIPT